MCRAILNSGKFLECKFFVNRKFLFVSVKSNILKIFISFESIVSCNPTCPIDARNIYYEMKFLVGTYSASDFLKI